MSAPLADRLVQASIPKQRRNQRAQPLGFRMAVVIARQRTGQDHARLLLHAAAMALDSKPQGFLHR
jgi:hypothetical protein